MKYTYDDGGRSAAGFRGSCGDCVVRAVAIAAELPYGEVYKVLSSGTKGQRSTKGRKRASARDGVNVQRKWFRDYMVSLGFRFVACMGIGTGCTVHLHDGELPMGRLVVSVSRHYTAVVDGVIHDTHNPQREIYEVQSYTGQPIPPGWSLHPDGDILFKVSRRCVYGYWTREAA